MGNCFGTPEYARNKQIDREQRRLEKEQDRKIKVLLLGTGESGKSTLFKQIRMLYGLGQNRNFTKNERHGFKAIIFGNIIADASELIRCARTDGRFKESENFSADDVAKLETIAGEVLSWPRQQPIKAKEASLLQALWDSPPIQEQWNHRQNMLIQEAFVYYMESIDRIAHENWEPTNQDILRSRARTTGVVQSEFKIHGVPFEMYDVGGQKNERRKWIDQFDGVTTVLYVAAISDYNQFLFEDDKINRQEESVLVFRQMISYQTFFRTPFILFLNKDDLFKEKLVKYPFRITSTDVFDKAENEPRNQDFAGPYIDLRKSYKIDGSDKEFNICYEAAIKYLRDLYVSQAPQERVVEGDPLIYVHPTTSTDSENIGKIMVACKDIILRENLAFGGFM